MFERKKLAFTHDYFRNIASLLHQVLYESSEDGVGDGRLSVGQGSGPSGLVVRDTNIYSVTQTKSEEGVTITTKTWNKHYKCVLKKAVKISRRGKDTLDAALASGGCLNNHIEGSIVEYLRDQGFTVSKKHQTCKDQDRLFVGVIVSAVRHQIECLEKGVGGSSKVFQHYLMQQAVCLAVRWQNPNVLRKLLSVYSHLTKCLLPLNAFILAVDLRYEFGIQALIEVDEATQEHGSWESLMLRIAFTLHKDKPDFIKLCLNCVRNINNSDNIMGCTALHYASEHTSEELVDLVVSKGADLEASSVMEDTPLMFAVKNDKVFAKLIGLGANVFHKNLQGQTALHMDCSRAVVEVMLEEGLGVDTQDKDGNTPLVMALLRESRVAEVLLANGASIHVTNNRGETVVELFKAIGQRLNEHTYTHSLIIMYGSYNMLEMRDAFVEALIKLKVAEVRDLTQEFGVTEEKFKKISYWYLAELECMKQAMFGQTSLFDVAFKPDPVYATNQLLRDTMDETTLRNRFPMYFHNILEGFAKAERRHAFLEMVEELVVVFSQVMAMNKGRPGVVLPWEMSHVILAQLRMGDLLRLREALGLASR